VTIGHAPIAVDTSVVVAGLLVDHGQHDLARPVLASKPALPAHVAIESYSVLTRMPLPGRLPALEATELLLGAFGGRVIALSGSEQEALLGRLPGLGIAGGSVYDALVAATALRYGMTLHSFDRRAAPTYDAVGVDYELI